MTTDIKIIVNGALGKMGRVIANTLHQEADMNVIGGADIRADADQMTLADGQPIPLNRKLTDIVKELKPDVVVDFTVAEGVVENVRGATASGANMVIGTTGLKEADLKEIEQLALANKVGIMVAPNFAIGAVLMIHMAKIASKYMDAAEIIELHHDQKVDAPSGTARSTAREMASVRDKPFQRPSEKEGQPSRGEIYSGINTHSVRLPGLVAHQEVIFGGLGQTLTIRHDSNNRDCFLPGIILAVREIPKRSGFVYGLDKLLGLE
jgi:4-hydroxy-tetrahydrodipicolinate reductase